MRENSNTKKVSLVGESGKMGQALTELIQHDPELVLSDEGDVVIDFSSPEGTKKAIAKALAMGKPLVCGTTGLSKEIFSELVALSKKVPVLYSPNFSLGIALSLKILETMGERLKKFSRVTIEEIHHKHKVDAPSGTAKLMGELLGSDEIASERVGEVIGIHQVNFNFDDEQLSLRHEAYSRKAFAKGALVAAKFLLNQPAKYYKLSDVFY